VSPDFEICGEVWEADEAQLVAALTAPASGPLEGRKPDDHGSFRLTPYDEPWGTCSLGYHNYLYLSLDGADESYGIYCDRARDREFGVRGQVRGTFEQVLARVRAVAARLATHGILYHFEIYQTDYYENVHVIRSPSETGPQQSPAAGDGPKETAKVSEPGQQQ
jgi:hypothetical protein